MDRIGLSFEEYAELKVRPRVGADAAFGHAAEMALAELFPARKTGQVQLVESSEDDEPTTPGQIAEYWTCPAL